MSVLLESMVRDSSAQSRRGGLGLQLLSFLLIGGIAALGYVGLSMLMIGLQLGPPEWVMSALCYAAFIVPVYFAHRHYSFRSAAPHAIALPRYVGVQASALGLAALFSWICYGLLGFSAALAAFLVIGLTSGVNFVLLRVWAFAVRA